MHMAMSGVVVRHCPPFEIQSLLRSELLHHLPREFFGIIGAYFGRECKLVDYNVAPFVIANNVPEVLRVNRVLAVGEHFSATLAFLKVLAGAVLDVFDVTQRRPYCKSPCRLQAHTAASLCAN